MNRITGDLLTLAEQGEFDVIVHGANCFNTMASGIAGQIARRFPQAADVDKQTEKGDRRKLGDFTFVKIQGLGTHEFSIVNAYTQYTYSRERDVFEYDSFQEFLNKFANWLPSVGGYVRVGFPYIGCGLAGGDQRRIVRMIENFSAVNDEIADVTLVAFK